MNGYVIIGIAESYTLQGKVRGIKRCRNEKGKIMDMGFITSNKCFLLLTCKFGMR